MFQHNPFESCPFESTPFSPPLECNFQVNIIGGRGAEESVRVRVRVLLRMSVRAYA